MVGIRRGFSSVTVCRRRCVYITSETERAWWWWWWWCVWWEGKALTREPQWMIRWLKNAAYTARRRCPPRGFIKA